MTVEGSLLFFVFVFFKIGFLFVALAALKLSLWMRLASNFLCLLSSGVKGMCYYRLT